MPSLAKILKLINNPWLNNLVIPGVVGGGYYAANRRPEEGAVDMNTAGKAGMWAYLARPRSYTSVADRKFPRHQSPNTQDVVGRLAALPVKALAPRVAGTLGDIGLKTWKATDPAAPDFIAPKTKAGSVPHFTQDVMPKAQGLWQDAQRTLDTQVERLSETLGVSERRKPWTPVVETLRDPEKLKAYMRASANKALTAGGKWAHEPGVQAGAIGLTGLLALYGLYRVQRGHFQRQRARREQESAGKQIAFLKKLNQLPAAQRRALASQQLMLEQ